MSRLRLLREDSSLRRPAMTAVLLLAGVLLGELVLRVAFADIGGAGLPAWLPQFGTPGHTVAYYLLFFHALKFIALPSALLWLAYAYGRHSATDPAQ